MTIDERLETLTMNVELLSGMMKHFIETGEKDRKAMRKEIRHLEAISGQLAALLVNHEIRIQGLKGDAVGDEEDEDES